MEINESAIREMVSTIITEYKRDEGQRSFAAQPILGVFEDINDAIYESRRAFQLFRETSLDIRRGMIEEIRKTMKEKAGEFSAQAVEETGMGRWEDKVKKNILAAEMSPGVEDLEPFCFSDDHGLTLTERAPYGVIGAITPSTNPTATIINNTLAMLAAGNTVVFNPHPKARKVSLFAVGLINEAVAKAGGPENTVVTVAEPSIETASILMNHPYINLLTVTGGPGVVKQALRSNKKVIAAGPGNPPTVVDETADLEKAAGDIAAGASFDNNIVCICEKEIIAVRSIADDLKLEMKKHGVYELEPEEIKTLTSLILDKPGRRGNEGAANKEYVGKDAPDIASSAGISVPEDIRLLLCEVDKSHPLVWTEQLMPVIPLVRVEDVDEAIDFAVDCEHGFRHSASMHSLNIAKLSRMARAMDCSLFVKNGSNFNGMGFGGAGYTSFTIASPTGEGFTRARTFTRERRCALIDYFRII